MRCRSSDRIGHQRHSKRDPASTATATPHTSTHLLLLHLLELIPPVLLAPAAHPPRVLGPSPAAAVGALTIAALPVRAARRTAALAGLLARLLAGLALRSLDDHERPPFLERALCLVFRGFSDLFRSSPVKKKRYKAERRCGVTAVCRRLVKGGEGAGHDTPRVSVLLLPSVQYADVSALNLTTRCAHGVTVLLRCGWGELAQYRPSSDGIRFVSPPSLTDKKKKSSPTKD